MIIVESCLEYGDVQSFKSLDSLLIFDNGGDDKEYLVDDVRSIG
jgi:hypothetical protein